MIRHEISAVHLEAYERGPDSGDMAAESVPSCSNCGDRVDILGFPVYSRDGIPFCSPACMSFYAKPVEPDVHRTLWGAVSAMFLGTALLLLLILTTLSRKS
jgi:hypothetical protein